MLIKYHLKPNQGKDRAKKESIPHFHLSGKHYPDPKDLDLAILSVMINHSVDIIVLAGYMKKLGPKTLAARVLEQEHILFSETLQKIVNGEITLPISNK